MENLEIKKGYFFEVVVSLTDDVNLYTKIYGVFDSREEAVAYYEEYKADNADRCDIHRTSVYEDDYIQVGERVFMQRDIEPIDEN